MEDTEQATATSLIEADKYLKSGAHIGTRFKSGDMRKYIYKIRKDGLNVLDVQTLDERIKFAANFLSQYAPEKISYLLENGKKYIFEVLNRFHLIMYNCNVLHLFSFSILPLMDFRFAFP